MPDNPDLVRRLLDQARITGQWYCGQADAAGLCFEALAVSPGNREAGDLVYKLFCDEWLIYDNRNAIQQNIDEWDDRPWQQRRRYALSFRIMSRWEDPVADRDPNLEHDGPADVSELLRDGKMQLLHAYCLGDDECTNFAWPLFADAFRTASDPQRALLWVALLYADLGFFADAAEVLAELCSRFPHALNSRLLVEVLWWRDNAHRLPWLPPSGDGSRYRRMMAFIDPHAPFHDEELISRVRAETVMAGVRLSSHAPSITPGLTALVAAAVPAVSVAPAPSDADRKLVDWSFLDRDDGQPGELPEWAKKMARRFPGHIPEDMLHRYRWSRPITPPHTPPRRRPDEPGNYPGDSPDDDDQDLTDGAGDSGPGQS